MRQACMLFFVALTSLLPQAHAKGPMEIKMEKFLGACFKTGVVEQGFSFEQSLNNQNIKDLKNGYWQIEGKVDTCSCTCRSTVAAFKNKQGSYAILGQEQESCGFLSKAIHSEPLETLLSFNLDLSLFSESDVNNTANGLFYAVLDVPQRGTETRLSIRPVYLGMSNACENEICTNISAKRWGTKSDYFIEDLKKLASDGISDTSLTALGQNSLSAIEGKDMFTLLEKIGKGQCQGFNCDTLLYFLNVAKIVYQQYEIYSQLDYDELVMKWDKSKGKFNIKQKNKVKKHTTLKEFIMQQKSIVAAC